jgi:PPOX class probable F420-dependent enzyme
MAEKLTDPRVQTFLATKQVVVLATVGRDGAPLLTPMWFLADGESLVMVTHAGSAKTRNVARDPRVAVVAEAGTRGDIRGVHVSGRAEHLTDPEETARLAGRLLDRYHPDLERRWAGRVMPPDRVMYRIVPARVSTWGLAG